MKNDRHLLVLLLAVYVLAVGFVIVGANAELIVAATRAGISQEWLGFAGAVLGSAMTIIAGVIAWFAAQSTIAANETLAERRERDTYAVVQSELRPKVEMFVRYWRVIQKAWRSNNEIKANGVALIRSIADHGISDDWLDEMRKVASDLSPVRRRELIDVLQGLRLVREQLKRDVGEDNRANHFWLLGLRTMLSHFERYLRVFDVEIAKHFDRFTKSAIDHRDLAEHVDPLITNFEQTGNIV